MDDYLLALSKTLRVKTTERPARSSSDQSNAMVIRMLTDEFHVHETLIKALRPRGLTHPEIRRVLSIAKQMPGGINRDNVRKVLDMRQEGGHKKAWIEIVRELGVALDHRASRAGGREGGKI